MMNQQRIWTNKLKQEAKLKKDLQAIKNNDFTDTSLADLTRHLSLENTVNNHFVLDKDVINQKTSIMEQQITQNLILNHSESMTDVTSRPDRKPNNRSTLMTTDTNSNYGAAANRSVL